MDKLDLIELLNELRKLGWTLQALKQNEPPSCGHTLTPTGEAIAALQKRVTELEDHLLASVKAQDGSIAWLQKQVRELEANKEDLTDVYEAIKNQHIRLNAIENILGIKPDKSELWKREVIDNLLGAGCDDPEECAGGCLASKSEPSVPVSELRAIMRVIETAGHRTWEFAPIIMARLSDAIAKAEGDAK